jgi:hypothetical protein
MKWIGRLTTSVAAVLLMTGGGSASTAKVSDDAAWAEVVKSNTLEAYAKFAVMYPDSKHAQLAYSKLFGVTPVTADTKPDGMAILDDEGESAPGLLPGVLRII